MAEIKNQTKKSRKPARFKGFHQAKWNEPIIFDLSNEGQRGILLPEIDEEITKEIGDIYAKIPEALCRDIPPKLPELSQAQVLRHFLRLSQETLGTDFVTDLGHGTCTMKYSPKINEQLARLPELVDIHPLQDERTVQGILEIMYKFEQILCEISGLDRFSLQPGGGSAAIYTCASIIRAYHESRNEHNQRNEIITTIFSHPSDAACPKTAGYKVITLYPDSDGYPDLEGLKAIVSNRTAGLMITNPEDTGIFNSKIDEFVNVVHDAGGLCFYDQANANGVLGITSAGEAGFDLCHFNLHKTFSSPHGSGGPAVGAVGVREELAKYLPVPIIDFDGTQYSLNYDRDCSIGKIRSFYGVPQVVLRSYAWVMSLGPDGLREVAEIAALNNNYLMKQLLKTRGISMPYAKGKYRIEQVRYSWEQLTQDTEIHTEDILRRAADYGVYYFTSHHPYLVPEPCTLEPTESYTKQELDEFAAIMEQISDEAYENPEIIRKAPHKSTIHAVNVSVLDDMSQTALSWRAYQRKIKNKQSEEKHTLSSNLKPSE